MARTLGALNLEDRTKYHAVAMPSAISWPRQRILFDKPSGGGAISKSTPGGLVIRFPLLCVGSSYAATWTNFVAVRDVLELARDYQLEGSGSAITYVEQILDEGSARTYTVLDGDFDLTQRLA